MKPSSKHAKKIYRQIQRYFADWYDIPLFIKIVLCVMRVYTCTIDRRAQNLLGNTQYKTRTITLHPDLIGMKFGKKDAQLFVLCHELAHLYCYDNKIYAKYHSNKIDYDQVPIYVEST